MTHIRFTQQLRQIVDPSNISSGKSYQILSSIGGLKGIEEKLNTNRELGILDNEFEDRAQKYGKYTGAQLCQISLNKEFKEQFKDQMLRLLLLLSIVWIFTGILSGFFKYGFIGGFLYGGIQGITLFVLLMNGILVKALVAKNKYQKFAKFTSIVRNDKYTLKRNGKIGNYKRSQIRIGDLMSIKKGDFIKEDCILVQGNVIMDEYQITGYHSEKQKCALSDQQLKQFPIKVCPLVNSGCEILSGQGQAIILTIDNNTVYANVLDSKPYQGEEYYLTPLQQQLSNLAERIGSTGLVMAFLIFIGVLLRYFVSCLSAQSLLMIIFSFISFATLDKLVEAAVLGLGFAYLFIPDTLPIVTNTFWSHLLHITLKDKIEVRSMQLFEEIRKISFVILDQIIILDNDKEQMQILRDLGIKFMRITEKQQPEDKMFDFQEIRSNFTKARLIQLKQKQNNHVLYTGSDIELLEQTKGVSLGISKRQKARRSSWLHLQDSSFSTLLLFFRWGNLFNLNVKRFTQFFISNNLTLLTVLLIDSFFFYNQYFTTFQMVWLKIFCDAFAVAIYAYDRPARYQYSKPIQKQTIVTKQMWLNIFYQVLLQSLVLVIFMIFDFSFLKETDTLQLNNFTEYKVRVYSMFFFMQLANMINCRDISRNYKSIFLSLQTGNALLIITLMMSVQIIITYIYLWQLNLVPFYCVSIAILTVIIGRIVQQNTIKFGDLIYELMGDRWNQLLKKINNYRIPTEWIQKIIQKLISLGLLNFTFVVNLNVQLILISFKPKRSRQPTQAQ